MEKYTIEYDLNVFGSQVKTFPQGIGEAFSALVKIIPDGLKRPYYGISYFSTDGKIIYKAAALEKYEGEAEKYNLERYIIEKGIYFTEAVFDWRRKTDCIKDVFKKMMQDGSADSSKPCIEWYKSDDEMLCMIKMKEPG